MNNYIFRDVNEALPMLMDALLRKGEEVGSRNGRVKEFVNNRITLVEPWRREILHPTRKASIAAQIAETMWVLDGRNDVAWLSAYLPRAAEFSDDGKVWRGGYGPRIRAYRAPHSTAPALDQLDNVVEMLRKDPLTRQAVIEIADMSIDCRPGKDIPCTRSLQFQSRLGRLHMTVTMRSNDVMWGWSGINAFEWSTLQEIVAGMLGIEVGTLTFNAGSFHLYEHHWERAKQIVDYDLFTHLTEPERIRFDATVLDDVDDLDELISQWFQAEAAIRERSTLASRLVDEFPEPMFQAWLRVIQWYWTGDEMYLDPLAGTALRAAVACSAKRPSEARVASSSPAPVPVATETAFVAAVTSLHLEKHKAYGDSWKRRGEMLGIMANIARKIDRLGVDGAGDTATDTAVDLLVYLVKYRVWLADQKVGPGYCAGITQSDDPETANTMIRNMGGIYRAASNEALEARLTEGFALLESDVVGKNPARWMRVDTMAEMAFTLAERLWYEEQERVEEEERDGYKGADHE